MDKVQKIREEIERLKGWNNNVRNSTRHMTLQEEDFNRGKHSSYIEILDFIDSLQEEPVSIWHDANQHPEINTPILVRTYDNIVVSTKRYDDNLIPWEDRIKRDEITHWCYVEDLLNL